MTRFCDLLQDSGWVALQGDERLDAASARAAVARLVDEIGQSHAGRRRLTVFCVTSPREALLAYFAASRLGLFAAVCTPRTLTGMLAGQAPGSVARIIRVEGRAVPAGAPDVETCVASFRGGAPAARSGSSLSPARFLFCTSGTTGDPKRVVCDERLLLANAAVVTRYLGLRASDLTHCAFPVTFMYGLSTTLCSLLSGGTIRYRTFVGAEEYADVATRDGATVLPILGDWAADLARSWSTRRPPARRVVLNASDRLTRAQAEGLLPHATALWNNFGQTESGPRLFAVNLTTARSLDALTHADVVAPGYPVHPSISVRVDARGDESGFGAMEYRSPFRMVATWERDGSFTPPPEWIASGDLMRRTPDGAYLWAGRTTHTMKVKGIFVSLRTVTDALLLDPGVRGVGFTKDGAGRVHIYVEHAAPSAAADARLADRARQLLAGAEVTVCAVKALPRTESGKVDYRRLTPDIAA